MASFPDTEKKLRNKISSYRSSLKKDKKNFGSINDGSGKRYLLFYYHFVLDDLNKSRDYFEWYKKEFSDDVGEPIQKLCWALSLHRLANHDDAQQILAELMLSNLYLIPNIIGHDIEEYDIWHASNCEYIDYPEYIPVEVRKNIRESELKWMETLYNSFDFRRIRNRYIEIYCQLQHTREIEKRKCLLDESYSLLDIFYQ